MNRRTATLALLLAALMAIAGVGQVSAHSKHHPMTARTARADYLKFVTPSNAAIGTWNAYLNTAAASEATGSVLEVQAKPLIAAYTKFQVRLEDTNWPKKDESAADSLAAAVGQVVATLQSLSTVNLLNEEEWVTSYASADNLSGVDANLLRHDLGLVPVK